MNNAFDQVLVPDADAIKAIVAKLKANTATPDECRAIVAAVDAEMAAHPSTGVVLEGLTYLKDRALGLLNVLTGGAV